jgi:methyl coenzyme M reductase beta subunit
LEDLHLLTERTLIEEIRTMKALAVTLVVLGLFASCAVAVDGQVPAGKSEKITGFVSDEQCGTRGLDMTDCIKKCESEGKKLVFVTDSDHTVLSVTNQEALKGYEGQRVSITAQNVKGSLHVTKVEALK